MILIVEIFGDVGGDEIGFGVFYCWLVGGGDY